MGGAVFTPVQSTFRGKDDDYGLNVDNGWLADLGLDWTQYTGTPFRVRYVIQETGGKAQGNANFEIRYSLDSGPYLPVTTTSAVLRNTNSSQFADDDPTTQLIGSGTYVTGESDGGDEDGLTGNIDYAGNDEAEIEFCVYIPHDASLDGKSLEIRVYLEGGVALNSYTDWPNLTIDLLPGMPESFATGNVQKGGNIVKTSGGTYYGVFRDGTSGIKIWKDVFGTPASAGAATATEIHGGGAIDWISAALDGNDDIHIVSSCSAEQTRDVAYRVFDTGIDSWVGSWDEAYNYTATPPDNQNHIAVDANNDAHIVCCDLQGGVDQVFYTNNISGWLTPERVNTDTGLNQSDPIIICDPTTSTDVHVWYYADGNNDPAYRKRTSGSWGSVTEPDFGGYQNIAGWLITSGGTRYGYAINSVGTNLECEQIMESTDEGSGVDSTYNTPYSNEHEGMASVWLLNDDRYIAYVKDADSSIHVISNAGSGWVDEGQKYPGVYKYMTGYWATYHNNFSGEICFLFDDGTGVYAGTFSPEVTPTYIQEYFRIRKTDGQGLNNAFDGGDPAENANTTIGTGEVFRIRFKVRETAGSGQTIGYKLQYRKNAGTWYDLDTHTSITSIGPVSAILSNKFDDGDPTNTELLTNVGTFVNGEGAEDNTLGTYTFNNQETEFEWCMLLQGFYDDFLQNIASDTIEFRVVEADGTLFVGAYTNPIITVVETVGFIGGNIAESPMNIGPFKDANDNLYTFIECSHVAGSIDMMCIKSTDGGETWREMDGAGRPTANDLEGIDVQQVGDKLHILHMKDYNSFYYHEFTMSDHGSTPDEWVLIDEVPHAGGGASVGQYVALAVLSDGSLWGFWPEVIGGLDKVVYSKRTSGGTWDVSPTTLDTEVSTHFPSAAVVVGENDLVHIFYKDMTNGNVYHRSLSSGGTLSDRELVEADTGNNSEDAVPFTQPIYWDDAGAEKIMICIKDDSDSLLYSYVVTNDGSPESRKVVSDNTVIANPVDSDQVVANLVVDPATGTAYVLYADLTDSDLYLDEAENDGGWGTDTEQEDGVTIIAVRGNVFAINGATILGYLINRPTQGFAQGGFTGCLRYGAYEISSPIIIHEETQIGTSESSDTIVSAALAAVEGDLYLCAVSTKARQTVSTVVGLNLTWNYLDFQCGSRNTTGTEIWWAQGTPSSPLTVTVTLAGSVTSAVMSVSRYSGVDSSSPIGNEVSANYLGVDGICTGDTDDTSYTTDLNTGVNNTRVYGASSLRARTHTPGSGYTERVEVHVGGGGDIAGLAVEDKYVVATAIVAVDGVFSGLHDWSLIAIAIKPQADNVDNLDAVGITTNPVVGTPAIGQEHDLTATGITANPVVGTPTISQIVDLTANGISTTPAVDTPTLGQVHPLDATGITADPVVGTSSIGQEHALTSIGITADPVVGTPVIGQEHVLAGIGIATNSAVGTPSVGQAYALSATGVVSTPVVGVPSIGQEHALDSVDITADPVVGISAIGQEHDLDSVDITADSVVGTPSVGQEHALDSVDITTDPVLSVPSVGQKHVLDSVDITANPVVGTPSVGQEHALDSVDITADPVLDTPTLGTEGEDVLIAVGIIITPAVGTPSVGQEHDLDSVDITANPILGTPTLTHIHNLDSVDITANPTLGTPTLTHIHNLDSVDITANPVLDTPFLSTEGEDNLIAVDITVNPVLDTPAIGQEHVLSGVDITADPVLDTPSIGQEHALDSVDITADPGLSIPSVGQEHALDSVDITADPVLDTPSIGQEHTLDSVDITANPTLDTPVLSSEGEDNLVAIDITVNPVVDTPSVGQEHVLSGIGIITTPVVGTPVLSSYGEDNLVATGIIISPVVETSTIGQIHVLNPTDIAAAPVVGDPAIGQTHALSSTGIDITPVLATPILSHIHVLNATGITTVPVVEPASIGQIHVLDSTTILVSPILDVVTIGQIHTIAAVEITSTPVLGVPSWELVEGIVVIIFSTSYPEIRFIPIQPKVDFTIFTED